MALSGPALAIAYGPNSGKALENLQVHLEYLFLVFRLYTALELIFILILFSRTES